MDNFYTRLWIVEKQWNKVLDIIKSQVSPANFRMWFAKTTSSGGADGKLIINVVSSFNKSELSTKYQDIIDNAIKSVFNKSIEVDYKITSVSENREDDDFEMAFTPTAKKLNRPILNPNFRLENFVVGLSNQLAYAAAQAVSSNPGISYNPLFIYGGTGVGKTHLMVGIGNILLNKNPYLKIIYCPLESFTNDFVQSIQTKRMNEFRAKYRNCDLLLIDDVQFLSGRDSTQEEFFHTFNDLQAKNCQVVLTSDRPPNEIQKLESRLASRFQGGLMVDIQQPDFDTRVAILKAKCNDRGEIVPENVLSLIAENMPTNTRELEGKLIQIIQTCKLTNQEFNEETIRKFLGTKTTMHTQKIDHKKVLSEINQYFNIKMMDITGPKRKKELVLPRQVAMYILYQECRLPYEKIGEILGGRDHTTIMHGVEKIGEAINRDREIQKILLEIRQNLGI